MSNPKESPNELSNKPIDYVTSAIKGTLGAIPFAGSLLAELVGTVIPNQRLDRIAKFVAVFEVKLSSLEQKFIRSQLTNENFSDLLEEVARQAARSLSNERREYIANLIANSLSQQDIEYIETKHLLSILGELNDIEIIWLLRMASANALDLGDVRWKLTRPICGNLRQFSTPYHFSGWTSSPSLPQRRYPLWKR